MLRVYATEYVQMVVQLAAGLLANPATEKHNVPAGDIIRSANDMADAICYQLDQKWELVDDGE